MADKQCDVVGIIFCCSSPIPCSQFEQNKIQTKVNNRNKTDDHNKQVNESGPLTNRRSFEQIINHSFCLGGKLWKFYFGTRFLIHICWHNNCSFVTYLLNELFERSVILFISFRSRLVDSNCRVLWPILLCRYEDFGNTHIIVIRWIPIFSWSLLLSWFINPLNAHRSAISNT